MDSRNFFAKLKQRKLVQWALAYSAAAFALLQGVDIVASRFGWPEQTMRFVIIALSVGFFATLVLAWYHGERGAQRVSGTELLILALLLAIGGGFLWRFGGASNERVVRPEVLPAATAGSPAPAGGPEKSIAVLPFENLSSDKENAYFADGVQDEVLTDLAKVADLKVISRTSVMRYKSTGDRDLRQIAQQLGVVHVVEGSVQRSANRVRVNAQLIDARTDAHLWAQTFDRELADVFAIQSEIAKAIADQLQAKISPREEAAMSRPPTTDLEANRLYLEAKNIEETTTNDPNGKDYLLRAEHLANEAVTRDPNFVVAHCLLVTVRMDLYFGGYEHTAARLASAKAALDSAARIQQDSGEAHLARADYLYHGFLDFDGARAELELARRTLPNSAQVPYLTALMDRRQGRWTEAEQHFRRALELDPRNVAMLDDTFNFFRALHRYSDAKAYYERVVEVAPQLTYYHTELARNVFFERADVRPWRAEINSILREKPAAAGNLVRSAYWCAMAERDPAAIEREVVAIPPQGLQGERDNAFWPRESYAALAARAFGDTERAKNAFTAARLKVEQLVNDQPDYAPAWSELALVDAGLGRKEDAIREALRARDLVPLSKDTLLAPAFIINLAMVYAWTGEKEHALEQLETAAKIPNGITYGELKLYPMWDALRGDPRFEKIVASLAPKVTKPNE